MRTKRLILIVALAIGYNVSAQTNGENSTIPEGGEISLIFEDDGTTVIEIPSDEIEEYFRDCSIPSGTYAFYAVLPNGEKKFEEYEKKGIDPNAKVINLIFQEDETTIEEIPYDGIEEFFNDGIWKSGTYQFYAIHPNGEREFLEYEFTKQ